MNILFLSKMIPVPWAGPTYSVPNQIESLSKCANVCWYNLVDPNTAHFKETFENVDWRSRQYYYDLTDVPGSDISQLPKPFHKPDLIVVEQMYAFGLNPIIKTLPKSKIPYVIIPRGEFTASAQKKKKTKKAIANAFLYRKFYRNAKAIQYLTAQEQHDSGKKWNKNSIIISNGIVLPSERKTDFCKNDHIKVVSIGRLDPFHKGYDLLIDGCVELKDYLSSNCVTITIYGPDRLGKLAQMQKEITDKQVGHILKFEAPLYNEDKKRELLNCDVFIMTSRFEGHPMSLIEAMGYGLPIVATTGSNMRAEIEEMNAGWGADNTVEGVKAALIKMIQEKSSFSEKSINARKLAEKYEWDCIARKSCNEDKKMILM